MIVASPKYNVQETSVSIYEARMTLTIRKFQKEDIGSYRCIAKNSLGEVDSSIRLYGKLCSYKTHLAFQASSIFEQNFPFIFFTRYSFVFVVVIKSEKSKEC